MFGLSHVSWPTFVMVASCLFAIYNLAVVWWFHRQDKNGDVGDRQRLRRFAEEAENNPSSIHNTVNT